MSALQHYTPECKTRLIRQRAITGCWEHLVAGCLTAAALLYAVGYWLAVRNVAA